jgi:hypothetical protein
MDEAEHEMPGYERDMLVRQYIRLHDTEATPGPDADVPDPFASVPDDLKEVP